MDVIMAVNKVGVFFNNLDKNKAIFSIVIAATVAVNIYIINSDISVDRKKNILKSANESNVETILREKTNKTNVILSSIQHELNNSVVYTKNVNIDEIVDISSMNRYKPLVDYMKDPESIDMGVLYSSYDVNDPLIKLNYYTKDDLTSYIINDIDFDKKIDIDNILEEEASNDIYKLDDIPDNVVFDSVKSAILYNRIISTQLFSDIKNEREKIIHYVAVLNSISKIETGKHEFSTTVMSPTNAWGRPQINGTTLGMTVMKMLDNDDLDVTKVETFFTSKDKYLYNKVKSHVNTLSDEYYISKGKHWSWSYKTKIEKKVITFVKRFVKSAHRYVVGHKNSKEMKQFFKNGKVVDKEKLYDIAIKAMLIYKNPEVQGLMSLAVFDGKQKTTKRIFKSLNTAAAINKKTFQLYNADPRIVDTKEYGKIKMSRLYAEKTFKYYNDNLNTIYNNIENEKIISMYVINDI